jgi:hypothetical protein
MWPGKPGPLGIGKARKPDVKAVACMKNCVTEPAVASMLPDFARNAHGNLAEQNRMVGAQLGADTTRRPAALGAAQGRGPRGRRSAQCRPRPRRWPAEGARLLWSAMAWTARSWARRSATWPRSTPGGPTAGLLLPARSSRVASGVWGAIPMPAQTLSAADIEGHRTMASQDGAKK